MPTVVRLLASAIGLLLCVLGISCGYEDPQQAPEPPVQFLYAVSSDRILAYRINPGDGILTAVTGSPFPGINQGFAIVANSGFLFVVGAPTDMASATVLSFRIDPESGALSLAGNTSVPALVSGMNAAGHFLYIADYGGLVRGYRVNADGSLSPTPDTDLPGGPIGIATTPQQDRLFVGLPLGNAIASLTVNVSDGTLVHAPGSPFQLPDRRLIVASVVHTTGRYLYGFDENSILVAAAAANRPSSAIDPATIGGVMAYSIDLNGALRSLGGPYRGGTPATAGVVHPNGRFLYVVTGTRVAAFRVESSGTLADVGIFGDGVSKLTISGSGHFLYTNGPSGSGVVTYGIGNDGALTNLNVKTTDLPISDLVTWH